MMKILMLLALSSLMGKPLQAQGSPLVDRTLLAQNNPMAEIFEVMADETKVFTASRREQSVEDAPAAVEVITRQEIENYDPPHLWDLLRFKMGMDVIDGRSADGNRALVSVRGNPSEFVAELLILLDGRPIFDAYMSGVYWNRLPVQIQDIERIEIVRGPNAALYGSNAVSGVINIITKRPEGKYGVSSKNYGGSRYTVDSSNAFELGDKNWGVRGSQTYFAEQGNVKDTGYSASDDFLHSNQANVKAFWKNDKTSLDLSAGVIWDHNGIPGYQTDATAWTRDDMEMLKVAHHVGEGNDLEMHVSRYANSFTGGPFYLPNQVNVRAYDYEGEALHRLSYLEDRSQTTYGASYRYFNSLSADTFDSSSSGYPPNAYQRVVRGFLHQTFKVAEPLTLVGGVSVEDSHTGGTQPAWQLTALVKPHESHTVRLSYAVSSSLPSSFNKYADYHLKTKYLTPGIPTDVWAIGNQNLIPQTAYNYEVGYLSKYLDNRLSAEVVGFYTYLKDMNYANESATWWVPNVLPKKMTISYDNSNRSITRGAELRLTAKPAKWLTAFANYAYISETVSKPLAGSVLVSGTPSYVNGGARLNECAPKHKFNVGGTADLGHGFSVTPHLGYKDNYQIGSYSRGVTANIPRAFRMDLHVSYKPVKYLEVFVAGKNLFQPYQMEYVDTTAVPRTFFGGVTAKF